MTSLGIRPLTPELWPALDELFSTMPVPSRCWCMYFRIGPAYRSRPPASNRADLRSIVEAGPPPGLLAFDGDLVVGWLQLTPRDGIPYIDRVSRLKRVDDVPVWAISCITIRTGRRRQGIGAALIAAAVDRARDAGAPAVEGYPLDGSVSPSATSTGYASTFARLGFTEIARRSPERPIMRFDLSAD